VVSVTKHHKKAIVELISVTSVRLCAKAAVAEGDYSKEFKFRPRGEYRDAYSSFVIGGLYDVYNDMVTQPFQGTMDQVAYYSKGIPDKHIKMLSEDVPCAEGQGLTLAGST